LNDKGRVAISDKLGNAVDKVEGIITAQNSDSYTIAISQVYQLGGATSKWSGEAVTIQKDETIGYQIHRFNRTRTIVLVAAITAAAVVFLATVGLKAGGSGDTSGVMPPTQPTQSH
jgi:hypothetical protein